MWVRESFAVVNVLRAMKIAVIMIGNAKGRFVLMTIPLVWAWVVLE